MQEVLFGPMASLLPLMARDLVHLMQCDSRARDFYRSPSSALVWAAACHRELGCAGQGNGWLSYKSMREETPEFSLDLEGSEGGAVTIVEGFGSGILLSQRPCLLQWPVDWSGSLVRAFSRVEPRNPAAIHDQVARLRDCLNSGAVDLSGGGAEALFQPVLSQLFTPGAYDVSFRPSEARKFERRYTDGPELPFGEYGECQNDFPSTGTHGFFPWELGNSHHAHESRVVLFTQPMADADQERVRYYEERISLGSRPIVLAAEIETDSRVVIDGHHKFMAYLKFPLIEPAWLLVALDPPEEQEWDVYFEYGGPFALYAMGTRRPLPEEQLFLLDEESKRSYSDNLRKVQRHVVTDG